MGLLNSFCGRALLCALVCAGSTTAGSAQAVLPNAGISPKVTRIGLDEMKVLLRPSGKPRVVNFWATWCDPCREEFPDLVRLSGEYSDKVDFVTISLDDLSEIDGDVPKFLAEMRSTIPAFLLKVPDEDEAIRSVSKDWTGNLPLTIVFDANGMTVYQRNGKFRSEILKENIDRSLGSRPSGSGIIEVMEFVKIKGGLRDEARYYYENNWRAFRDAAVKRGLIDSFEYVEISTPSNAAFDIVLITRYRGEAQFDNSEKAFEPLIKELRPNGPFLKGAFKPDDFREIVYSYTGKPAFYSAK